MLSNQLCVISRDMLLVQQVLILLEADAAAQPDLIPVNLQQQEQKKGSRKCNNMLLDARCQEGQVAADFELSH